MKLGAVATPLDCCTVHFLFYHATVKLSNAKRPAGLCFPRAPGQGVQLPPPRNQFSQ